MNPAENALPEEATPEILSAVRLTPDVVYGSGVVGYATQQPRARPLRMDVRQPLDDRSSRPAIVMAFGGAFHRGSKEDDALTGGKGSNTSTAWYADYWAARGFVTFCIDYRLVQEDPAPGTTIAVADLQSTGTLRMQAVRALLGLPPADPEALWRGVEAASDDMAAAARFVRDNAATWGVDPSRIGLWGWSAGARTALNAVFAEGFEARALVGCSAYADLADLQRLLPQARRDPATLLVAAQHDLPHIRDHAPGIASFLGTRLAHVEYGVVADADHFYPADAMVCLGGAAPQSLLDAMTAFLREHL